MKHEILSNLVENLRKYQSLAIAFSGGVDSTFLAYAARRAPGVNAVALTVDSEAYPPDSIRRTRELAAQIGIPLYEIPASVLDIPRFAENPPDRCYHCKKALFGMIIDKAESLGIDTVADGSIADDDSDFRPGHRALRELGVVSPLKEAGLTKAVIRELSREADLPTWNQQSFACLASRFPYGEEITAGLLERTWKAEQVLADLGITQYRVRNHGDLARIEVNSEGFDIIVRPENRSLVTEKLTALGYSYVALDLKGYRTGSMNEVLRDT